MFYDFLVENQSTILEMTEQKSLLLAGARPSSEQLRRGLPIFYAQLLNILKHSEQPERKVEHQDVVKMVEAARNSDQQALSLAEGKPDEADVAKEAGLHGTELLRLGYTLSHVVHAYGAMCQSITELSTKKMFAISSSEFHDLNACLDVAIAGAVTEYQAVRNTQEMHREVKHLGFLAHELRNTLTSVNISFDLIKNGTVGLGGNTGRIMAKGLKRLEELIDRSLTEVRLSIDPEVHVETGNVLQLVDQIIATAEVEAKAREQVLEISIDPDLVIEADQQLVYSAVSNLVQNAIKYSPQGGRIQVRGKSVGANAEIEVEDECGGLPASATELFKAFSQKNNDRTGLGLGLTIVKRAVALNHGTVEVRDLPGKGCIFKIGLPKKVPSSTGSVVDPRAV
jgi:signal transduction histidine kinase